MLDRSFRVLHRVRNWTGGSGQTAEFRGPSQKEAARPPVLNEWALLFKTASAPSANAEQPLPSLRVLNLGLRFKVAQENLASQMALSSSIDHFRVKSR